MQNGCLYIRVSTDEQLELSPDAQERLLLDYAHKNNILISKEHIFYENGVSGRKADKRPEFQKMIALAKSKEHPFDVILVWKFSRFARNQEESIVYKSLLKRNHVDVVSISEPLPDGMIGSLVERIFEWMDEYYSINLSAEVKRGMTENALHGNYQGSMPLGYKHVGYKEIPIVDEEQSLIVKRIFSMFLEGSTFTQIARWLNENNCRTIRGGAFENRTVRYLLQNPFYIGKVRWNYYDRSNNCYHDEKDVIVAEGRHEPIIDMNTWERTQERLAKVIHERKPRDVSTCKHWLSGVLICSSCGASLAHSSVNGGKVRYFQCYKFTKGICTASHYVNERDAEQSVMAGLEAVLESRNIYHLNIIKNSKSDDEIALMNKAVAKLDIKLAKIKDAYIDGIDTLEEYKENKRRIQTERDQLTEKIAHLSEDSPAAISEEDRIEKLLDNIRITLEILKDENATQIEKGNTIRNIIEKIVYNKTDNTYAFYYFSHV